MQQNWKHYHQLQSHQTEQESQVQQHISYVMVKV